MELKTKKTLSVDGKKSAKPDEQTPTVEMVQVTVLIPKPLHKFLKAVYQFGKYKESFESLLGFQIQHSIESDFGNLLTSLFDIDNIAEGYGLRNIPNFNMDC